MTKVLTLWILLATAIGLTAAMLPGMDVDGGVGVLLVIALVYSLVNIFIGTVLRLLTLPLTLITLGLFGLVVNAVLLAITAWSLDRLSIDGFLTAVAATVLITVFSSGLQIVFLRPSLR